MRALQPIADELGVSLAQLAIAWCLLNPHVSTVMLGASRSEQLAQNLDALDLLPRLDAAMAQRIGSAWRRLAVRSLAGARSVVDY